VLDIDHTLLHAQDIPTDVCPPQYENDQLQHLPLVSSYPGPRVHHHWLKLRPHLHEFLDKCSHICVMTLYTHGTRAYAEGVASILDPTKKYFGHRIFSRTDLADLGSLKSIDRICVGGEADMALVMDDNEEVWRGELKRLMLVKPYVFFRSGQEVNNAPGDTGDSTFRSQRIGNSRFPDSDNQLMRSFEIIKCIHREKYPTENVGDVSVCLVVEKLVELKKKVLRGVVIAFSGVLPTNIDFKDLQNHPTVQSAISLGAVVCLEGRDTSTVSHLVTLPTHLNSAKVRQYTSRKHVWVVHLDWLKESRWSLQRALETDFLLADAPLHPRTGQTYSETLESNHVLPVVPGPASSLSLDVDSYRKRPRANSDGSNVTESSSSSSSSEDDDWLMNGIKDASET